MVASLWGLEKPTKIIIFKILVIVFGVVLASAGEIHFSWIGFLYNCGGLVFESIRVVMIQELMSGDGMNMDPLVSLYYYAPICAITNFFVAWITEWQSFHWAAVAQVGLPVLVLNALIAFCLNVSSVMLVGNALRMRIMPHINCIQIGKTSGLILHLTGVLKNILLVAVSVIIWGTAITSLQAFGYSVALIGFIVYKTNWEEVTGTCLRATR